MRLVLVERGGELAEIAELVARGQRRDGGCLVIEGAAGLGKSAVLVEAALTAEAAGVTVLTARGGELEQELSYSIVRQLFDRTLHRATPAFRAEVFADAARHAAPLFGYAPGPLNPAAIDHALYWLLANLSEHGPILLVVDDAHWADDTSLRVLRYLAQRITDLPVALLLATRPSGRFAGEQYRTLYLEPLTDEGVSALLAGALGDGVDDEFRHECFRLTGGNPFLVTEIVAGMRDAGAGPTTGGLERLASPESIVGSVLGRVARIGGEATGLARAAALLGPDASLNLVGEFAGVPAPDARQLVSRLTEEGVLSATGGVIGFIHPLLRAVVYDDMAPGLRAARHRSAADLLARHDHGLDSLVPHLLLAVPAGDQQVVTWLTDAAGASMAAAAPELAAQCLSRALTEPPVVEQLPQIYRNLGAALSNSNRMGEALQAYGDALASATDEATRNEVAVEFGWLLMMRGLGAEAAQVLGQVGTDVGFTDLPTGLQAALTLAGLVAMDPPRDWSRKMDDVDQLAEAGPDRQLFLANHAFAATACADRSAAEVIRLVNSVVSEPIWPQCRFMVINSVCPALTISDDVPGALRVLDAAIDAARADGDVGAWRYFVVMRARISPELGNLMDAEADARLILDLDRADEALTLPIAAAMLVEVLLDRGHIAEAAGVGTDLRDDMPEGIMRHFVLLARGRLARHQRRYDDALSDQIESGRLLTAHGYDNPGFLLWRTEAALTHLENGDREEAARMALEHLVLARQFGAARGIGIGLWVCALAETGDRRIALLQEADEVLAASTTVLPAIRVKLDLGSALRSSGRRRQAMPLLKDVFDVAGRIRADGLARRAYEELTAAGAVPRSRVSAGVDALTASELRVARYAAAGLTNRQIAQELFVSRRTVELHLTNAFRKLGIEGRDRISEFLGDM